jgi:hypothetical protein
MIVEQLVEWRLAGDTEVLGENLPQRHYVHHKSHMTRPGLEPRDAAVGSQQVFHLGPLSISTENGNLISVPKIYLCTHERVSIAFMLRDSHLMEVECNGFQLPCWV